MGTLKDELAKVKSAVSTKKAKSAGMVTAQTDPTVQQCGDKEWTVGVKPLRHDKNNISPSISTNNKPSGSAQNKSQVQLRNKPKSHVKGRSKKRRRGSCGDSLPSNESIRNAYGNEIPRLKRVSVPYAASEVSIPGFDMLPQVILTRPTDYKEPDAWVQEGAVLQLASGEQGRVLKVRMGIDFGTSFTKVALRIAGKVYFVNWEGVRNSDQAFLLPGEISRLKNNTTKLGRPGKAIETLGGLKSPFLTRECHDSENYVSSVVFLAWVMRYSRAWLYERHSMIVRSRRLAWEINIGCPTDPWSSLALVERYKHVVQCAWKLSQTQGDISMQDARSLLRSSDVRESDIGLDGVNVIPEFVAQIAGYVNSPQRVDGLHLLVDVGAGTMDIAAFNIYRNKQEGADRYPIFDGAVEPLGTHILMSARMLLLGNAPRTWEDLSGIPSLDQLSKDLCIDASKLQKIDEGYSEVVCQRVYNSLSKTKSKRYPGAPEWKGGLRVFLAGGGSSCAVYQQGVKHAFEKLGVKQLVTPFPALHDSIARMDKQEFHRLSVAFGLTYDAESVGKIIRPQEIEDIVRVTSVQTRPDRDELYAK